MRNLLDTSSPWVCSQDVLKLDELRSSNAHQQAPFAEAELALGIKEDTSGARIDVELHRQVQVFCLREARRIGAGLITSGVDPQASDRCPVARV